MHNKISRPRRLASFNGSAERSKTVKRELFGLVLFSVAIFMGCQRPTEARFVSSEQVARLDEELRRDVESILAQQCGTPAFPRLLGEPAADEAYQRHLRHGATVYARYCQQCHGLSGDGQGPAAAHLDPRPRDYRRGIFKFTSTPYGAKPRRDDLIRTVRRGIIGTSMPSFKFLPDDDMEAVVDYILVLTHRGELEVLLAAEAELEEEVDPELVPDYVDMVLDPWRRAGDEVVLPETLMPHFTEETIAAGREAFMTKGCSKCHGADGRGQTQDNVGVDAWQFTTKAADLTSGMLRGGQEPLDIYRRISSGINGTPMPSFKQALAAEPETIWHLVHYVLHVSNQRRQGHFPETVPSGATATARSHLPEKTQLAAETSDRIVHKSSALTP